MSDSMYASTSLLSNFPSEEPNYNAEFVYEDPKLKCIRCHCWLKNPYQTACGHRICLSCLNELLPVESHQTSVPCPAGEEDCEPITRDKVYPDASAAREIRRAKVFCPYRKYGCQETPQLIKLKDHVVDCSFIKSCQYCKERLPPDEIEEHLRSLCKDVPVSCQYNCGVSEMPRREMEAHYNCCTARVIKCKYNKVGCHYEGSQSELLQHENDVSAHVEIMITYILQKELAFNQLQNKLEKYVTDVNSLTEELLLMKQENQGLKQTISQLQERQKLAEEAHSQHAATLTSRVTRLENQITGYELKVQELVSKYVQAETRIQQVEISKQSAAAVTTGLPEEIRKQFVARDVTIGQHSTLLSDLDLRLQCTETTNYDGVLIWKISDYSNRKQQACSGRIISLYSQPFYTSRYGYKMCARVYLNGDGAGRNTHMSLFFVVMQGDYDEILSWPFRQKVTLCLLDQVQNKRHLTDTFRPDPASTSFKKPTSAMNVASGCPLFVPQTTVENPSEPYLRNETIFIKVVVDTSDLVNC